MSESERRQYQRHAWRLPCTFRLPEGEQVGFATNISARGFFVQTRCKAQPGEQIVVTIEHEPDPPMILTGAVVRARRSHRSMSSVEQPGFGFRIDTAPETFYCLVLDLEEKE
ncbi:MAG: PilZ domain-containing protein [bacterium]|nr:PilZ domain-containing protein [bacterium]